MDDRQTQAAVRPATRIHEHNSQHSADPRRDIFDSAGKQCAPTGNDRRPIRALSILGPLQPTQQAD